MAITLEDFAVGDTDYIPKLNSNNGTLETVINGLLNGVPLPVTDPTLFFQQIFSSAVTRVDVASYAVTKPTATSLSISAGVLWIASLSQFVRSLVPTVLDFTGLAAGTYYVNVTNAGVPSLGTTITQPLYFVVWSGTSFTDVYSQAPVAEMYSGGLTFTSTGYQFLASDDRRLVIVNGGSYTLQPFGLPPRWHCWVNNTGTTGAVLTLVGATLNGSASTYTIPAGQGCSLWFDGANFYTGAPGSAGSVGPTGATGPQGPLAPAQLVASYVGKPPAGGLVLVYTATAALTFAANFSPAKGTVGTNPTSTAVFTVLKNGTAIGTITVGTGGTVTFATSGGTAQSLAIGDRLTMTAPATQDATLADYAFTLVAAFA